MSDDSSDMVVIGAEECLDLLRDVSVGRLAWADDSGSVTVLPVNFAIDGGDVIFCTSKGLKLTAIHARRELAFQADDEEPAARSGWSVLAHGHAWEVEDADEAQRLATLVQPWADAERPHVVRLQLDRIDGRRIPLRAGGISIVYVAADGTIS